jgi:hypothetical protein
MTLEEMTNLLESQVEIIDVDRIKYNAFIVALSIQIAKLKISVDDMRIPQLSSMIDQTNELSKKVRELSKLREKLYDSVAYYNELVRKSRKESP